MKSIRIYILSRQGKVNWITAHSEIEAVLAVVSLSEGEHRGDTFLCTDTNIFINKQIIPPTDEGETV